MFPLDNYILIEAADSEHPGLSKGVIFNPKHVCGWWTQQRKQLPEPADLFREHKRKRVYVWPQTVFENQTVRQPQTCFGLKITPLLNIELTQNIWPLYFNVTDRRTDARLAVAIQRFIGFLMNPRFTYFTYWLRANRAVKVYILSFDRYIHPTDSRPIAYSVSDCNLSRWLFTL